MGARCRLALLSADRDKVKLAAHGSEHDIRWNLLLDWQSPIGGRPSRANAWTLHRSARSAPVRVSRLTACGLAGSCKNVPARSCYHLVLVRVHSNGLRSFIAVEKITDAVPDGYSQELHRGAASASLLCKLLSERSALLARIHAVVESETRGSELSGNSRDFRLSLLPLMR